MKLDRSLADVSSFSVQQQSSSVCTQLLLPLDQRQHRFLQFNLFWLSCLQVIGLACFKALSADGIGFAIPIDTAKDVIQQLEQRGRVIRPYIGIKMLQLNQHNAAQMRQKDPNFPEVKQGILVPHVAANSPAARSGLREGDVITGILGSNGLSALFVDAMLVITWMGEGCELHVDAPPRRQSYSSFRGRMLPCIQYLCLQELQCLGPMANDITSSTVYNMSGCLGITVVCIAGISSFVLPYVVDKTLSVCRVCWTESQLEHQSLDTMLESARQHFYGREGNQAWCRDPHAKNKSIRGLAVNICKNSHA